MNIATWSPPSVRPWRLALRGRIPRLLRVPIPRFEASSRRGGDNSHAAWGSRWCCGDIEGEQLSLWSSGCGVEMFERNVREVTVVLFSIVLEKHRFSRYLSTRGYPSEAALLMTTPRRRSYFAVCSEVPLQDPGLMLPSRSDWRREAFSRANRRWWRHNQAVPGCGVATVSRPESLCHDTPRHRGGGGFDGGYCAAACPIHPLASSPGHRPCTTCPKGSDWEPGPRRDEEQGGCLSRRRAMLDMAADPWP
ncbi:hypothetical protein N658DRAFT_94050 [Parathielavia hyrcaniae]|uniref:Uncharacterized protein n=1 Tax=Parathielavia hyrcaniae TaxID=113614 RepID=A0AAN6PZI8_9PEZI|nr:hypothetical protein N658DRAFT_94050 [Parathielavia hyrcaniae]